VSRNFLLNPVLAFLAVIAAEMLIDGLMKAGVTEVSAIVIGAVGGCCSGE
jgi:hypothetical protein